MTPIETVREHQMFVDGAKGNWLKINRLTSNKAIKHSVKSLTELVGKFSKMEQKEEDYETIEMLIKENERLNSLVKIQADMIRQTIEESQK